MNKNVTPKKQTLQEVMNGEEPTEEFLEEFHVLTEAEELSDLELGRQAMAAGSKEQGASEFTEPDYKVSENGFFHIFLAIVTISLLYYLIK